MFGEQMMGLIDEQISGSGIKPTGAQSQTIAPYGLRHRGFELKGTGFFGPIPAGDGLIATEISSEADGLGEYPLINPLLTGEELKLLLAGEEPTDEIFRKAETWAKLRISKGLSPFASSADLRLPIPK